MGAYVVRTSSLNDMHSCQLFRMGLRDKITPTLTTPTTPLIKANMSCGVATIFSSLAFLSSSVCIILQSCSSFSMANLSCLLATTFSSLSFLSNSLSSPRFNLLRVARCGYLFSYFRVLSSAFLSSVLQCLKLCLL